MNYKGHEELKDMNKGDMINMFKDKVNPDRKRGGINTFTEKRTVVRKDAKGGWYNYELTSYYSREVKGTDSSRYRPIIGDTEYTWGELKAYPADLLRVMLYKYLIDGSEEEE